MGVITIGDYEHTIRGLKTKMSFNNFRKKPRIIEAVQIHEEFEVETLEGKMKGKKGDYLIIGIKGETYPCDKEIFEESYDKV